MNDRTKIEKIIKSLLVLHDEFQKNNGKNEILNSTKIRQIDSRLSASIDKLKIKWIDLLIESGLNPASHISQLKFKNQDEKIVAFKKIIQYRVQLHGIGSVSDGEMNSKSPIDLPDDFIPKPRTMKCFECGCPIFKVSKQSIYAQGRDLFGNWKSALEACQINYEDLVLKKKASLSIEEIIKNLDEFDLKNNGNWCITDIRAKAPSLNKSIYNSKDNQIRKIPLINETKDAMLSAYACLVHYRETGQVEPDANWWDENKSRVNAKFNEEHRSQETWSEENIVAGIQQIYAQGPTNARLSRQSVNESDIQEHKTLWSAMRQGRYQNSGILENDWLLKAGFLPVQLSRLYAEIDAPFDTRSAALKFANLMQLSINENKNCLSREYCKINEPDFHNYIINRFNSWSSGLKYFGLNPNVFTITPNKRTKRGFRFQNFFHEFLVAEGFTENKVIKSNFDFISNKSISTCTHSTKCKPDFLFLDKIIDTKTGYHASQKPDQILRYLDHQKSVVILTLNDKYHKQKVEGVEIEVVGFSDFLNFSEEFLGIKLEDSKKYEYKKKLSNEINRDPFWK